MTNRQEVAKPLQRRDAWRYAGINMPLMFMQAPTFMVLPALYAKHAGLDLVAMGATLTALRIGDAVIDPLIGHLSDHTRSRFGRRRPWILAGVVLGTIGMLALFNIGAHSSYWWFTIAYAVMAIGWSMAEIPHTAWINGLSADYAVRTRLSTYRYVAGTIGSSAFLALPLLPFFPTTEMTPQITAVAGWLVVALLIVTVPLGLRHLPDPLDAPNVQRPRLRETLRDMRMNRPFWWYMGQVAASGLSSGLVAGLFYFYLDNYLQIGAKYSMVMFPTYAMSLLGAWAWLRWSGWLDKHQVIALCMVFAALTNVAMWWIRPGPLAFPLLAGTFLLSSFCVAGGMAMQNALMADVVDYGALKSGHAHAGNYFAALTLLGSGSLAVGAGAAMMIAGAYGFRPDAPNDVRAMQGFFLAIIWLPLALNLLAAWIAWKFPLDRDRHAVVHKRLAQRTARTGAAP